MTNFLIEDFKLGLDLRKDIMTAQPGSLQQLDNVVITPGGEIEKRKAFIQVATLPTDSFGLAGYALHQPNLFSATYPAGVAAFFQFGSTAGSATQNLIGQTRLVGYTIIPPTGVVIGGGTFPLNSTESFARAIPYGNYINSQFDRNMVVNLDLTYPDGHSAWTSFWAGNLISGQLAYPTLIQQKLYGVEAYLIRFSGVGDPSDFNPLNPGGTGPNTVHPGAGFIDISTLVPDAGFLLAIGGFYRQTAFFSRSQCLLFSLDPDPSQSTFTQALGVGCVGANTISPFGTGELIFAAPQGVRTLRALNSAMVATVSDIGSPVDKLISAELAALGNSGAECWSIIEPQTSRYWLAINDHIYVLNYWPSAKISAWSRFVLPFHVDQMVVAGSSIFIRSGTALYQYGGINNSTYDTAPATVVTPYHSVGTPTVKKKTKSVSAMVRGNWAMSVSTSPEQSNFYELTANLSSPTYAMNELPFAGFGSHVGFKFTCSDATPALLGSCGVRFEKGYEA